MSHTAPLSAIAPLEETHTSVLLHRLLKEAPADYFTLDWFIGHLPKRSFGVILLFLALIAILPVISIPARILIIVLTFQIIAGYHSPALPRRWMTRPLPSRYLLKLEHHVIPLLEHLEMAVRPRWPLILNGTRRIAAFVALLLTLLSLLAPLPLSNVPPSLISVLMALSYIEHDGMLLTVAFTAAFVLLAAVGLTIFKI
jgi:hypothetical protein